MCVIAVLDEIVCQKRPQQNQITIIIFFSHLWLRLLYVIKRKSTKSREQICMDLLYMYICNAQLYPRIMEGKNFWQIKSLLIDVANVLQHQLLILLLYRF